MGNSFNKDNFFLQCLHCNSVYNELDVMVCSSCHNILVSKEIDPNINFNLKNYKKKITFIEEMCKHTKCRIQFGYNYLKQISYQKKLHISFKTPFILSINRPSGDVKKWDNGTKISYFLYFIDFYNGLVENNYKL